MDRRVIVSVCLLMVVISVVFAKSTNEDASERLRQDSSNETCDHVYEKCRSIRQCVKALRSIKKFCYKGPTTKCQTEKEMMDCIKTRDVIYALAFPKKRCLCNPTAKCFRKINLVYANGCFIDIDNVFYRKKEVELQDSLKANTDGKEGESTTASVSRIDEDDEVSIRFVDRVEAEFEEVELEETVFGDDGFRITPSRHRPTPSFHELPFRDIDKPVKMATEFVDVTTALSIEIDETTSLRSQFDVLKDKLLGEQSEITTDMKYRIVSIVIGSLFLFVIFAGVVCLAARRLYRSSMLYKRGKIIDQQQKRDGSALS